MIDPRSIPYFTAVTIRGEPDALTRFREDWFVTDEEGDLMFAPERQLPAPAVLHDYDRQRAEDELEATVMLGVAEQRQLPPDCPDDGRAAKMLRFLIGMGAETRAISPARWITLGMITGLGEADEVQIAETWLQQNPDARESAARRVAVIEETGYASLDLWMADHYGTMGLAIEPLEQRNDADGSVMLHLRCIGSGGAPDLLLAKIAARHPELSFEVSIANGPEMLWRLRFSNGEIVEKRHPETEEEDLAIMVHVGLVASPRPLLFETAAG